MTNDMTNRRAFFDARAHLRPRESQRQYHQLLQRYYGFLVPPGQRVLEVGCGLGDLLAAVRPQAAVGIDFSPATLALARERYPDLEFIEGEASAFAVEGTFD